MKSKLKIEGMHCSGCAMGVENSLKMRRLVKEAKVDYSSKIANVEFDENKVRKEDVIRAVAELGYKVKEM